MAMKMAVLVQTAVMTAVIHLVIGWNSVKNDMIQLKKDWQNLFGLLQSDPSLYKLKPTQSVARTAVNQRKWTNSAKFQQNGHIFANSRRILTIQVQKSFSYIQ